MICEPYNGLIVKGFEALCHNDLTCFTSAPQFWTRAGSIVPAITPQGCRHASESSSSKRAIASFSKQSFQGEDLFASICDQDGLDFQGEKASLALLVNRQKQLTGPSRSLQTGICNTISLASATSDLKVSTKPYHSEYRKSFVNGSGQITERRKTFTIFAANRQART